MTKKIILYGLAFIMLSLFLSPPANAKVVKLGKAFSENIGINTKDMPTRTDPIIKLDCVRSKDCGVDGTKFCSNNKCVPCTYSCPGGYSPASTGKCASTAVNVAGVKSNPVCGNKNITCYTAGADCASGQVCSGNACVACTYSCPSGYFASSTGKCASAVVSVAGNKSNPACPNQNLSCYTAGGDCASGSVCSSNTCVGCTYSCPGSGGYTSASSTGKCGSTAGTVTAVKSNGGCPDQSKTCYSAGVSCAAGSSCVSGVCQLDDPCAGKSCPAGQSCNPTNGSCRNCAKGFGSSCGCPTGQYPNGSGGCMTMNPCTDQTNPCASGTGGSHYRDDSGNYSDYYYYASYYSGKRDICVAFGTGQYDYSCVECSKSDDCKTGYSSGYNSVCVTPYPDCQDGYYGTNNKDKIACKATAFCASRCVATRSCDNNYSGSCNSYGYGNAFGGICKSEPSIGYNSGYSGPTPYICTGRGFDCSDNGSGSYNSSITSDQFRCYRSTGGYGYGTSETTPPSSSLDCGSFGGCNDYYYGGSGGQCSYYNSNGTQQSYKLSCLDNSDWRCQNFSNGYYYY